MWNSAFTQPYIYNLTTHIVCIIESHLCLVPWCKRLLIAYHVQCKRPESVLYLIARGAVWKVESLIFWDSQLNDKSTSGLSRMGLVEHQEVLDYTVWRPQKVFVVWNMLKWHTYTFANPQQSPSTPVAGSGDRKCEFSWVSDGISRQPGLTW